MSQKLPEIRPIDPKIKRQTLIILLLSLFFSGGLLFLVVWSSTKALMEEGKLKPLPAIEQGP